MVNDLYPVLLGYLVDFFTQGSNWKALRKLKEARVLFGPQLILLEDLHHLVNNTCPDPGLFFFFFLE